MKVALALGAGGARGLAHLGVLKALEDLKIKFDFLIGASAGGLATALYAYYGTADNAIDAVKQILKSPKYKEIQLEDFSVEKDRGLLRKAVEAVRETFMVAKGLVNKSLLSSDLVDDILADLLPDIAIEELPIPTGYVATDLVSAKDVVILGGNLRSAVKATGAIPGIFPPVELGDMLLVDGGATQKVPVVAALALGADVVIGVDVGRPPIPMSRFRSALDILIRIDNITAYRLNDLELALSDVVISPSVAHIQWYEFERIEEAVNIGYAEAIRMRTRLRRVLFVKPAVFALKKLVPIKDARRHIMPIARKFFKFYPSESLWRLRSSKRS
ncbi:MAG: patatin [Candidatus Hydrothermota bacterium]|nr:MAG: patatin [Candidatus Hydrothermae bacterium]